jgi:hypothetical protein
MSRRPPDLIDDLAVVQGEDYEQTRLVLDGDWEAWTFFGSIGTDTADEDGTFWASYLLGLLIGMS